MHFNRDWAGKNEDFIVQVSCMDKTSYVKVHRDENDIATQNIITFGQYTDGSLYTFCQKRQSYQALSTLGKLTEFDGRVPHYVSPITEGKRFLVTFFKSYDRMIL